VKIYIKNSKFHGFELQIPLKRLLVVKLAVYILEGSLKQDNFPFNLFSQSSQCGTDLSKA